MSDYLLGIDQGTSGSKVLVLDGAGRVLAQAYRPVARIYPRPGWVEQDPHAVAAGVAEAITEAVGRAGIAPAAVRAVGLTSQRNTVFAWEARSGAPLGNAITWQDLRTLPLLEKLENWPDAAELRHRLGYGPGPYMGALHVAWRLAHEPALAAAAAAGTLRLGLSTAWLLQALGEPAGHRMDTSMVQAMGLYDFRAETYWAAWLDWLGVPRAALPVPTATVAPYGTLRISAPDGRSAQVPVTAMIGDQQAALFGQGARTPGAAACTHGTASYVKLFLGPLAPTQDRINIYNAWRLGAEQTYCLEAATSVTGAGIRWLKDNARMFDDYADVDRLAASVSDAAGLVFVPAFTGLEVPYEDPHVRATLLGLTLGHDRGHILRAFLEAIGFQMRAIIEAMDREAGIPVGALLVDGGISASDVACQIQADLLGRPLRRPHFAETTAWAAGLLAGLGAGIWSAAEELPPLPGEVTCFEPRLPAGERNEAFARWQAAVDIARQWKPAI